MKKSVTILVVAVLVIVFFVSCGAQGGSVLAAESARSVMPVVDPITIRFGHVNVEDPNSQVHYGALAFANRVRELSGGIMQVQIYPAGQLGSSVDMGAQVQAGTLHIADLENASVTNFVPEAMWSDLPYIIQSYAHAEAVFGAQSSVSRWIRPLYVDNNFRLLGTYFTGFRHMMNNVNPIEHPSDMQGLVMRVMPSVVMMETLAAFGSVVVTTPFAEVPGAIIAGDIHGNEQPLGNVYSSRFYEIQPYLSMTGHFFGPRHYVFSEILWQQLTPAQQLIIIDAAEYALNRKNAHHHATQAILMQSIIDAGMQVTHLTDENMAAFISAGATVWPMFFEPIGGGSASSGSVIIDMILSYIP